MSDSLPQSLPEPLARAVRTANVPPDVRALVARLPETLRVRAELAPDAPAAALALVKLATLGGRMMLEEVRAADRTKIVLLSATRAVAADLSRDARDAIRAALAELLDARALVSALDAFAREAASLAALQTLTETMLRAGDLDRALHAMLSGVTSGWGLAWNRAALFVRKGDGALVGAHAIGPFDEQEAHRIWEELEASDRTLGELLSDRAREARDARLEELVRGIALDPSADPDVRAALDATGPITRDRAASPALARLGPAPPFVLAAVRARGELRGLLFADDAFSHGPVTPERLAFLHLFIDQLALVWDDLALLREVQELARVDPLTGVHNRRVFDEKLRDEASRAHRAGARLALLVLDVDHFKAINDDRGHAAGDGALCAVAALLRKSLREHDTVARIGGDEFAALLPGLGRGDALAVAARIGESAKALGISVSVGGAVWPDDTGDASALVAIADASLYAAKREGRARARLGDATVPF